MACSVCQGLRWTAMFVHMGLHLQAVDTKCRTPRYTTSPASIYMRGNRGSLEIRTIDNRKGSFLFHTPCKSPNTCMWGLPSGAIIPAVNHADAKNDSRCLSLQLEASTVESNGCHHPQDHLTLNIVPLSAACSMLSSHDARRDVEWTEFVVHNKRPWRHWRRSGIHSSRQVPCQDPGTKRLFSHSMEPYRLGNIGGNSSLSYFHLCTGGAMLRHHAHF